ncbi:hypothetical protein K7432_005103 [Basidiobolus ranarum]|uniref:Myb/SANT-like DNA-binding domain-containing protein n=1 Tax=Basidiobolus ranarum TaxID=34480 RepID=A0ABR2WX24_9FUNG
MLAQDPVNFQNELYKTAVSVVQHNLDNSQLEHDSITFGTEEGNLLPRGDQEDYNFHLPHTQLPEMRLNQSEKFATPMFHRNENFRDPVFSAESTQSERTPLKRERSENWQHRETQFLIEKWKKYYPKLKKHKRNMSVWEKIAGELKQSGFNRTATMCKSRVRVLMAKYKQCFVNNSEDVEAVANFDYFEDMKLLLSGNFAGLNGEEHNDSPAISFNPLRSCEPDRFESNWRRRDRDFDTTESDDDLDFDSDKKRKFSEEIQNLLEDLIVKDGLYAKKRENTLQNREQRSIANQRSKAEKERIREERYKAKEMETKRYFEMQIELVNSLVEAIKQK